MGNAPDLARPLAAPAGTARRVEELYTAHVRLVRSVCRSLLRDRNEAEDAVQQTFLSAQRALANGSSPREPAAWLATIARNECLARVRERMREPLPVDAEPTELGADAHSAAVSRYEVATLREALADLPRAQREAILLRELRGLSYDEVARTLSLTTGAVESLIFRARRTLQVRLSEALTALSPVTLLGRLFGGGGDLTGPAAVKVAAIGAGVAILAGGAVGGPSHTFGLGHAAKKVLHPPARAHVHAARPSGATQIWSSSLSQSTSTHETEHVAMAGETASADVSEIRVSEPEETKGRKTERETVPASTVPSPPPPNPSSDDGSGESDDHSGSDDPPGSDD